MTIVNRASALRALGAGAALAAMPSVALAQSGRTLDVSLLGSSPAIDVPSYAGLFEIFPGMHGYAAPKIQRYSQIETLTTTLLSNTAEIGQCDAINGLRAVEAGGNLKYIGNVFCMADLIFVVNADKVHDWKDLTRPDVTIAVNGNGDATYVMLIGPMLKRKIDPSKINVVELGGSSARLEALLSGRVDGVPIHIDQLADIQKNGNYKALMYPWKEYRAWSTEVWAVQADWLRKPENQRVAVDFMKAMIIGFRRANRDLDWYVDKYHKFVTTPNAATTPKDAIRPEWETLSTVVRAWPDDGAFTVRDFVDLMPVFKAAGAIKGTVKIERVIDPTYLNQALKELGPAH